MKFAALLINKINKRMKAKDFFNVRNLFIMFYLILCTACSKESEITITTESGISGECTWILTEYSPKSDDPVWRKLTISGNGAMEDYQLINFWGATNPSEWYLVDTIIINDGVTTIGDYAFYRCFHLKSIIIANSVTRIGDGAFSQSNLIESVAIPNNVIYIGKESFKSCSGLSNVTIPNSVIHIGSGAFEDCSFLTSVTMSNNLKEIGAGVFAGCDTLFSKPSSGIESSFLPNDDFWREGNTPLTLDGWYSQTYNVSLNGKLTSLSFTFHDKYDELGIDDCVYIETDAKRTYPIQQTGDNYVLDLKDVNSILIKSIRPGHAYVPYSQEITLNDMTFYK